MNSDYLKDLELLKDGPHVGDDAKPEARKIPVVVISDEPQSETLFGTLRNSEHPIILTILERDKDGKQIEVPTLLMPNVKTLLMEEKDMAK